jgi:hypothetical protein
MKTTIFTSALNAAFAAVALGRSIARVGFGIGFACVSYAASFNADLKANRIYMEDDPVGFVLALDETQRAISKFGGFRAAFFQEQRDASFALLLVYDAKIDRSILCLLDLNSVQLDSPEFPPLNEKQVVERATHKRMIDNDLAKLIYRSWTGAVLSATLADSSPRTGDGRGFAFSVLSRNTGLMAATVASYQPKTRSGELIEIAKLLHSYVMDSSPRLDQSDQISERLGAWR